MIESLAFFGWFVLALNLGGACVNICMAWRYARKASRLRELEDHAEAIYTELLDLWLSHTEKGGPFISPPPVRLKPIRH